MIFNSLAFVVFFLLVVPAYFLCPARFRWALLLAASCYFYMALVPQYILILAFIIFADFFLAQRIDAATGHARKTFFLVSLLINIGTLFFFKYFNFFNENIGSLAQFLHWNYSVTLLKIVLPIGLSFHTFQSLSYIIEVYRGKYKPERHLGIYALYVMFFPQLVAGPIERPAHFLPQLHRDHPFDRARFISGLQLMAWGFFKKIVIADRLAQSVDFVYGNLGTSYGPTIVVTLVFFAFQLYADFSGYSDIAVGAARLLGYDLTRNFELPYFATSVAEFWRRWHISLSNWLRDYVYYPLAFSAKKNSRPWLYTCTIITFLASGLWHGAGWTFVVMGALFGFYIITSMITKSWRVSFTKKIGLAKFPAAHRAIQIVITFVLVCFGWVFFRAPNIQAATQLFKNLFIGWSYVPLNSFATFGIRTTELALSGIVILFLIAAEWIHARRPWGLWIVRQPLIVRSAVYCGIILTILALGTFTNKQFIYFQF